MRSLQLEAPSTLSGHTPRQNRGGERGIADSTRGAGAGPLNIGPALRVDFLSSRNTIVGTRTELGTQREPQPRHSNKQRCVVCVQLLHHRLKMCSPPGVLQPTHHFGSSTNRGGILPLRLAALQTSPRDWLLLLAGRNLLPPRLPATTCQARGRVGQEPILQTSAE